MCCHILADSSRRRRALRLALQALLNGAANLAIGGWAPGKATNSLFEGWVDCEFIDFGKNVVVGQGSIIQSAVIVGNLIIIRKTIIDDDVRMELRDCTLYPEVPKELDTEIEGEPFEDDEDIDKSIKA